MEKINEFFEKNKDKLNQIDLKDMQVVQHNIYKKLKQEAEKFEEVIVVDEKTVVNEHWEAKEVDEKKSPKLRTIKWFFSKTKENALARWAAFICIGNDYRMWKNKNYFEFVLFDQERNKNVWTVMLLKMEDRWKKYLFFGPNPTEEFVSKVSSEKLYYKLLDIIIDFAKENNFDWILVDKKDGFSTNRGWTFQATLEKSILKDENWKEKTIDLEEKHLLWWTDEVGDYYYQENLQFVWEK